MRIALLFIAVIAAAANSADDPRPIPAELAANYFYANAQYIQAKRDLDEAASALQQFCGDKATPISSARDPRRLICNPKPEPPPATK